MTDAGRGIGHDRLGRRENVSALQRIRKALTAKSHDYAGTVELFQFDLIEEVAGINEVKAPDVTLFLGGVMGTKR